MQYDWTRFVVRIPIDADKDTLYKAWTSQGALEHWFLRLAEFTSAEGIRRKKEETVQAGDTYLWRWHGWGDETEERGKVLSCNGKNFFSFSFGDAGKCDVSIKEENGQTIVELVQYQIPTDEKGKHYWHLGCKTGWTFHLTNMKSIFEGGLDLRNKDVELRDVINA